MSSVSNYISSTGSQSKPKRRLSSRIKWIAIIVVGIVLVVIAWHVIAGMMAGNKKAPPPPPVHVALVHKADVTVIYRTIATVVSPATVQVNAQVQGKLLQAFFQEGQIVHKGDPLFLIDPQPFQNALEQAKAALAKDQATAVSDLNDQKRYTTLYDQNAISQQVRDQAVAAAQGAVATVDSDKAAVNIAEENLGYTRIVSPIDGKTGPIVIQPGNLITVAGATPLVTITQVQPIKVSFFLPQNQLGQIQNQMAAGQLWAIISSPAEKAKVDFVSNTVSATTGTIELRATFPNNDQRLVPGQTVNIGATLSHIPGALVVSRDTVNPGPDGSYVYLVKPDDTVAAVPVTVLNDDGTNDAIKGAIKAGDRLVADGQLRVVPGGKVGVLKGKAAPQAAATDDTP